MWLIRSAMCALMPPIDGLPGVGETGIDLFLARYLSETNWLTWLGVVGGTLIFTLTPLFTVGVPLPSFLLDAERLDRHADRIASHPNYLVRNLVMVLKLGAAFCWGADPAVRAHMNLPPYPEDPGTWRTT